MSKSKANSLSRETAVGDVVVGELLQMVQEGLLDMGVGEDGQAVYWPTERGVVVLGMHGTQSDLDVP